jgi:hypothetical protein
VNYGDNKSFLEGDLNIVQVKVRFPFGYLVPPDTQRERNRMNTTGWDLKIDLLGKS